ncbi:MAG: ATP-binding protein [Deltaproteobacteria bacterium]|nr:ATP-binding protein [Deltaproteobacteria bacterium]
MRELSLHILDIVENGITAGADCIHIDVIESPAEDRLTIKIRDNGRGISAEKLAKLKDPFVTSRTTRRVGLGLPLLAAAAERCDGKIEVKAGISGGTEVIATFRHSHIDRAPIGDMASTMATLMMGNPRIEFIYRHVINDDDFILDTRELKKDLGIQTLDDPMVIHQLGQSVRKSLVKLSANGE